MADISQFNLEPPDKHEWDRVEGPRAGGGSNRSTPPEGQIYTGRADSFTYGPSYGKKQLEATFDPLYVIGANKDGSDYEAFYIAVNVELYPWRHASSASDYLAAHGISAEPETNEEWVSLIESTAGKPFQFEPKWVGKCKACKTKIKGMENFPQRQDGTYSSVADCPQCGEKLYANIQIKRYVSALQPAETTA